MYSNVFISYELSSARHAVARRLKPSRATALCSTAKLAVLHGSSTTWFQTSRYCRAKVEFNSINWVRHCSSTTFETGLRFFFFSIVHCLVHCIPTTKKKRLPDSESYYYESETNKKSITRNKLLGCFNKTEYLAFVSPLTSAKVIAMNKQRRGTNNFKLNMKCNVLKPLLRLKLYSDANTAAFCKKQAGN